MIRKILVVSHAGVLDVNRAIFQELARRSNNLELVMIVPTRWRGDLIRDLHYERSEGDIPIRVIDLPVRVSGNGSLYFFAASIKKSLQGWQPDAVFVDEEPWSLSCWQAFKDFRGIPVYFFTKQNLKKTLPAPFEWLQRAIFAQSAAAFSVASEVTEVLRWKGYARPILDLPHSFDPACFYRRSLKERNERKASLGIPTDARVVSYFGRLTEEKGIDELISAMKSLSTPGTHFLWVGNGPMQPQVRAAVDAMPFGTATLIPALPHDRVGATLTISDVLVLPSRTVKNWKEQFGRILVEAWASGSAVIGSNSGEIPHLIARSGGGLVFPEGDAKALSQALETLLSDTAQLEALQRTGNSYAHGTLTHQKVAETLARNLDITLRAEKELPSKSSESRLDAAPW
jgi:glycosyltransferase involved in cell wall biosynthesis